MINTFYEYLKENEPVKEEKKHSKKWHECVDKVRATGNVTSPEAVCTASLGDESYE